jgi:hypothetical protein
VKRAGKLKSRVGDPIIVPGDTRHATWTDALEDAVPGWLDLALGLFYAETGTSDLEIAIDLNGRFPGVPVRATYELLFDTDNNPLTGATVGPLPGVDRILRLVIDGTHPFTMPGEISAALVSVPGGTVLPLPPGEVERIVKFVDVRAPASPRTLDHVDSIRQTVPLPALALAAAVPTAVRVLDSGGATADETMFVFNYMPPTGPALDMSPLVGPVGQRITVTGDRFAPGPITILVDDVVVARATAGSAGDFTAGFRFPAGVLACDANNDGQVDRTDVASIMNARGTSMDFFVTARDGAGGSDFSVYKRTTTVNDARVCALRCTKPQCGV